jgi:hypothetical protein
VGESAPIVHRPPDSPAIVDPEAKSNPDPFFGIPDSIFVKMKSAAHSEDGVIREASNYFVIHSAGTGSPVGSGPDQVVYLAAASSGRVDGRSGLVGFLLHC